MTQNILARPFFGEYFLVKFGTIYIAFLYPFAKNGLCKGLAGKNLRPDDRPFVKHFEMFFLYHIS